MRPARAALAGGINAAGAVASVAFNAFLTDQAFGPRLSAVMTLFAVAGFVGAALPDLWLNRASGRTASSRFALALVSILLSTAMFGLMLYHGRFVLLYGEFNLHGPAGPAISIVSGLAASIYVYWSFGLPLLLPLGLLSAMVAALILVRR